jgi:hypothetical protein
MTHRRLAAAVAIGLALAIGRASADPAPPAHPTTTQVATPETSAHADATVAAAAPAVPDARVRAWQVGLARPDRLQHAAFAFTAGMMFGLTSEAPSAAAVSALGLGLAKELWDQRQHHFDVVDLLADAVGAAGAAAATITLTR